METTDEGQTDERVRWPRDGWGGLIDREEGAPRNSPLSHISVETPRPEEQIRDAHQEAGRHERAGDLIINQRTSNLVHHPTVLIK